MNGADDDFSVDLTPSTYQWDTSLPFHKQEAAENAGYTIGDNWDRDKNRPMYIFRADQEDTINYVYAGHVIASFTAWGNNDPVVNNQDNSFTVSSASPNYPQGYQIVNGNGIGSNGLTFRYDGKTHNVNLTHAVAPITVKYFSDENGSDTKRIVKSGVISGTNDYDKMINVTEPDAATNSDVIGISVPSGYEINDSKADIYQQFTSSPKTIYVPVVGHQVNQTMPITLHLKDADGHWSTRQITVHVSGPAGDVQNFYSVNYVPSVQGNSDSGYVADTSHYHPAVISVKLDTDGNYTILNNVNQNGDPVPNAEHGTGQFWYQITNNVSAPLVLYYLDQYGHQVGCPVKIQGTVGHSVNVTSTKDGGEPLPKGYTLRGGITQNGHGSDSDVIGIKQDTIYQLRHQPRIIYLRLTGNAAVSAPVTIYQIVEHKDGPTTVKKINRDLVKDHSGNVHNGDMIEIEPSDYNPNPSQYSVDYSRSSNQFIRICFDQNTNQSFIDPKTFFFYYQSKVTSGAPIMIRYIDDQTGTQVGDTQFLNGNLNNKVNVTNPHATNDYISGQSVPFGYHLDTSSNQFPTDSLVNSNRKAPIYQFTDSPQNLNLPVQGNSDRSTFHLHVIRENAQGSLQGQISDVPITINGSVGQSFNVNPYYFSTGGVITKLPGGQFTAPKGYHVTNSDADLQIRIDSDGHLSPEDNIFYTYQQNYEPQRVGTVRIHYIDGNISDINPSNVNTDGSPKDEHEIDAVSDKGIVGNDYNSAGIFDLTPYRDDIPEALAANGNYQSTGKALKLHRSNNNLIINNNSGNQWYYSLNNNGFDNQGNCDVYIQVKKRGIDGHDSGPIIISFAN